MTAALQWRLGFAREVYQGLDAGIPLDEIDMLLPFAEIDANVELAPEPVETEI